MHEGIRSEWIVRNRNDAFIPLPARSRGMRPGDFAHSKEMT